MLGFAKECWIRSTGETSWVDITHRVHAFYPSFALLASQVSRRSPPGSNSFKILFLSTIRQMTCMQHLLYHNKIYFIFSSSPLGVWLRQRHNSCFIYQIIFTLSCLLKCLFVLKFLPLQNALVVPHAYNWTFTIRPNDIREDRLSRDITENVHSLVARR